MARYFRLNSEQISVIEGSPVLKASDYACVLEANRTLDEAKRQAEKIVREAQELYESERKRGFEEGLLEAKLEMTEQMISTVEQTVEYLAAVEQDIVDVVGDALEKVIGQIDRDDLIAKTVTYALQVVRSEKSVTVRVAPQSVAGLKAKLNEILASYPAIIELQIQPDSRLDARGCIIESPIGIVDASLDVQLSALRKAFQNVIGDRTEQ